MRLLRKIAFWLVWLPLSPFVFGLLGGFLRPGFALAKMGLVRLSVWQRFVEHKAFNQYDLLGQQAGKRGRS